MIKATPFNATLTDFMELIHILDIGGTFAFAVSGAFRAVKYEMDILGIAVLAMATGIGGGVICDLLLGIHPPAALQEQSYILICLAGAASVFFAAPKIARRWDYVLAADAIGLSVFTVIGAVKADAHGAVPLLTAMLAMITACGGGIIRDLLSREIPAILTTGFYASAALLGGFMFVLLGLWELPESVRIFITIAFTLLMRALALKYKFNLPRVKSLHASPSEIARAHRSNGRKMRTEK
ncbi:trimeric intracellular cation channel family protein [Pontiellaceae bacterium B12219]|nr:trimeric intracellular cation channel family protein [Pontiellaceae bacterium B12219]